MLGLLNKKAMGFKSGKQNCGTQTVVPKVAKVKLQTARLAAVS